MTLLFKHIEPVVDVHGEVDGIAVTAQQLPTGATLRRIGEDSVRSRCEDDPGSVHGHEREKSQADCQEQPPFLAWRRSKYSGTLTRRL